MKLSSKSHILPLNEIQIALSVPSFFNHRELFPRHRFSSTSIHVHIRVLKFIRICIPSSNYSAFTKINQSQKNVLYWGEKYKTRSITNHITHNWNAHIGDLQLQCWCHSPCDVKLKGFLVSNEFCSMKSHVLNCPGATFQSGNIIITSNRVKKWVPKNRTNWFESQILFKIKRANSFTSQNFPISRYALINHSIRSCSFD